MLNSRNCVLKYKIKNFLCIHYKLPSWPSCSTLTAHQGSVVLTLVVTIKKKQNTTWRFVCEWVSECESVTECCQFI